MKPAKGQLETLRPEFAGTNVRVQRLLMVGTTRENAMRGYIIVGLGFLLGISGVWAAENAAAPTVARPDAESARPAKELADLVHESDRVILVERIGGGELKEVAAIKGPARCGADAFLASLKGTLDDRPAEQKSWLLFLREDSDGQGRPKLAPMPDAGWVAPATDKLIDQVKSALVPGNSEWAGGYSPHSDPPTLVKREWARKQQFGPGQDIVVEVAVKNSGKTVITIPQFRYNIYDYYPEMKFYVTLPDGRQVILAKPVGNMDEADSPADRTLQPGEVYVHTMRLNRWPPAAMPGYEQELGADEEVFGRPGIYGFDASYDRVRASRGGSFEIIGGPGTKAPQSRDLYEGNVLEVGGKQYVLKCLGRLYHPEKLQDLPDFGFTQDGAKCFVWHKGHGWVIDPLRPDLHAAFECRWPVKAVSADTSLAVVALPDERRHPADPLVGAVVDLKKNQILGRLPLVASKWGFSSDGRFVWPTYAVAKRDWFFFDVRQKKVVTMPLIDAEADTEQYWSGVVLPDGKTVLMSVRVYDKQHRVVQFDLEKPGVVDPPKGIQDAAYISGRFGDDVLYYVKNAASILSIKTWESRKVDAEEVQLLEGRRGPANNLVFCLDSFTGLRIRDLASGKDLKFFHGDGWFFNARTLGVTFSADGRIAVVPTPYDGQLTLLDTSTRKVTRRIQVPVAPAGAFLIDSKDANKPGICLVVGTDLPYE